MAVPSFSELKTWLGKVLKNTDWDFNFQKIIDWLTTDYDVTFDTVNSNSITIDGTATAGAFVGDGSGLTNLPSKDASTVLYKITDGQKNASGYPTFLTAGGSTASAVLNASTTYTFTATINGSVYTTTSNITISGLSTAPSSNNTCTCSGTILTSQVFSRTEGEFGSTYLDIASVGSEIVSLSGTVQGFKQGSTEYFLGYIEQANATSGRIKNIIRGDCNGTRLTLATNATITLMKINYLFLDISGVIYSSTYYPEKTGTAPALAANKYYYNTSSGGWYYTSDGSAWAKTNRVYIGRGYCDSSNCVAVQPDDFDTSSWNSNAQYTMEYLKTGSGSVRVSIGKVNIAGINIIGDGFYGQAFPLTTSNVVGGAAISTASMYYLYLKSSGDLIWETNAFPPRSKSYNNRGQYLHPAQYWRCIGSIFNDQTSNIIQFIYDAPSGSYSYDPAPASGSNYSANTFPYTTVMPTSMRETELKTLPPFISSITMSLYNTVGTAGDFIRSCRDRNSALGHAILYFAANGNPGHQQYFPIRDIQNSVFSGYATQAGYFTPTGFDVDY